MSRGTLDVMFAGPARNFALCLSPGAWRCLRSFTFKSRTAGSTRLCLCRPGLLTNVHRAGGVRLGTLARQLGGGYR